MTNYIAPSQKCLALFQNDLRCNQSDKSSKKNNMTLVDAFQKFFNAGAVITSWSRKLFWCVPSNNAHR